MTIILTIQKRRPTLAHAYTLKEAQQGPLLFESPGIPSAAWVWTNNSFVNAQQVNLLTMFQGGNFDKVLSHKKILLHETAQVKRNIMSATYSIKNNIPVVLNLPAPTLRLKGKACPRGTERFVSRLHSLLNEREIFVELSACGARLLASVCTRVDTLHLQADTEVGETARRGPYAESGTKQNVSSGDADDEYRDDEAAATRRQHCVISARSPDVQPRERVGNTI